MKLVITTQKYLPNISKKNLVSPLLNTRRKKPKETRTTKPVPPTRGFERFSRILFVISPAKRPGRSLIGHLCPILHFLKQLLRGNVELPNLLLKIRYLYL